MSPRPSVATTVVATAFLWVTMAIASLALWPIYEGTGILIVIAVGLVAGSAVAIAGAAWRWPAWAVMIATTVVFGIVGVPAAVPSEAQWGVLPTVQGLQDLVAGVALGWKQLLTISLPVGDYEALLVPALVLVLVLTVVGLSIALRSRIPELAVLSPVVLYLVALALGPDEPVRAIVTPIALLVSVLLWLVWFRWRRRRAAIRLLLSPTAEPRPGRDSAAGLRTAIGAVLILALSAGAAVVAANAVPPVQDRTVLRSAVEQPFDPRAYVSPLAGFRGYWREPTLDAVLFTVSQSGVGERIRLATMDTYDGVVFSVGSAEVSSESGSFTRVPSTVDQSGVDGDPVELAVSVGDYAGVWMPTLGALESVQFDGATATDRRNAFYFNATTGTAAILGGLHPGDSYRISAIEPVEPAESQLESVSPGTADVPAAQSVPEELQATLDGYVTGVEGAGARLVAMLQGLAAEGYISHGVGEDEPPSRSGHAADRIAELVSGPRMIGDGEQYAVAAALMARELGFPSRVVVGFESDDAEITGSDVVAWIEVNTAQYGWVAVDPNPPFREIPEELPEENSQVARPPTIVPPPVVESENLDRQSTPDSEQELPPDLNPVLQVLLAVLRVIGWSLVVIAILLAPFLVIVAAKLRRRRLRRRAPTALERIHGGWQEFEDSVVDHGLSPSATATRSEVASIAGGVQAAVLAAVADRAMFSPDDPAPSDADSVWRAVDELRGSLDAGRTRWQRVKARISLRSLGGYSVSKLFRR
ncbi:transglutaminase domain-containing protein [Salinibacterium soli]|uniref:Transglutaminase-like domain-containing protein n=1 Tax=Antiquaquibacter soli TaxID=3064523 RepID=A0ABT9BM86_9MICO|nr:transglutaminase-like domain-containing protein [Protaetiibacter sp. WY-16]MDO7881542.1 transglutaminase-like domain-containing protein [Protaetiibacter sp. WY-16]